jgi:hypothetical protein
VLQQAIAQDPDRVAQEIADASDGRSINNSAPILALVILSMDQSHAAKQAFLKIFPQVIRTGSHFYLAHVASVLKSKDRLRQGRIHPIDVLKALKTYQSGGQVGRSAKTWTPVLRIVDILESVLELSFDALEPTGQVFMHLLRSGDHHGVSRCESRAPLHDSRLCHRFPRLEDHRPGFF